MTKDIQLRYTVVDIRGERTPEKMPPIMQTYRSLLTLREGRYSELTECATEMTKEKGKQLNQKKLLFSALIKMGLREQTSMKRGGFDRHFPKD